MASPPTTPGESSSSRSTPDESVSHSSRPTPIEVRDAQYTHAHPAGFETSNGLGVPANEPLTKKARGRHVPTKQAVLEPGKRRSFTCSMDGCGKVFSRAEHLRRHVRSIHMDEKPFKCEDPTCGKRFTRRDNLLQHQRSHRPASDTQNIISWDSKPGPLERVNHTHDPPSASSSSMGVLLPSPLTTNPMPMPSSSSSPSPRASVGPSRPTPEPEVMMTTKFVHHVPPPSVPEIQEAPPPIHSHAHSHSHSHQPPIQQPIQSHPHPPIHHLQELQQPNYLPCFHGDTHLHVRSSGMEPRFVRVTVPVGDLSYHWTALSQQGRL
ncbi:unnamed protein product [Somion occarium]|uniref:C2H2-type domain-containing protein n=1 Tax=Somion occarium TaxID=3059160 RepID=A0ABP1CGL9_9APHY